MNRPAEMMTLLVSILLLLFPTLGVSYHTPDHFCEQCIADNCGAGNAGNERYLSCASSSCGDQCVGWVADRFGTAEGCVGQCDAMLATCQDASADSAGQLDDYCIETASECYASCEGGVEDVELDLSGEDRYGEEEPYQEPLEELDEDIEEMDS